MPPSGIIFCVKRENGANHVTSTAEPYCKEALKLHKEALVIDTQQPPLTTGLVFTPGMRESLDELAKFGRTQTEAVAVLANVLAREIQVSQEAGQIYLDMWQRSGVTAACGTYSGCSLSTAFESTIRMIANAQAIVTALDSSMLLVRRAGDIEQAHAEDKYGVVIDFQNAHPFADDLSRVDLFYGLGLRMFQLNYNLRGSCR